jgi:hypothetical protein
MPIDPIFTAGAGLLGNVANSLFQKGADKRQNKAQIDLWNMNNKYNHPSSQMARLREAGLNPNLVYGGSVQGATGQSTSAPTVAKEAPIKIGNPLETYANAKQQTLTTDNLRAQNTVLLNDAALKAANTLKTMNESGIKGLEKNLMEKTLEDQIFKINSDAKSSYRDSEYKFQRNMRNQFSNEQNAIINKSNFESILARQKTDVQNMTNAQKLQVLRDLEIDLKNKNADFYETNAILDIIGKILGLKNK